MNGIYASVILMRDRQTKFLPGHTTAVRCTQPLPVKRSWRVRLLVAHWLLKKPGMGRAVQRHSHL